MNTESGRDPLLRMANDMESAGIQLDFGIVLLVVRVRLGSQGVLVTTPGVKALPRASPRELPKV